ncbi:RNA polymerase sigma factor [Pseudaminobacter sp. NGMCC 1.201702]|uniref:RNA polymerase sigma factor n=1 Tax=Pseudaminobacter sp. NGMCC 1.201702 TaxID=3391825 RepID=UPI0039F0BDEE
MARQFAVERALRENWQRLFSYALRLCGDREDAADLLQACAVRALAASPPEEDGRLRPWLFAILRNVWIDDHRHQRVSQNAKDAVPETFLWCSDQPLIAAITVRQALERLEPKHREIIELVDLAGFRYIETAEILSVPVGTVMSRLSRARLSLLEAIEGGNYRPPAALAKNNDR